MRISSFWMIVGIVVLSVAVLGLWLTGIVVWGDLGGRFGLAGFVIGLPIIPLGIFVGLRVSEREL